ncbi:hypothetical protein N9I75_06285 [Alphaproteobacteria bacterium]|nr:hypothetical protein [Alphaproteobacteria bacterium]
MIKTAQIRQIRRYGRVLLMYWQAMAVAPLRMHQRHFEICRNKDNATAKPKFQTLQKRAAYINLAISHHHLKIITRK